MTYVGPERRSSPRIFSRFMVSYRLMEDVGTIDVSQTKNMALGGMLLTTNRYFSPGTKLAIEIRMPIDPVPIMLIARVIDSAQITKDLIYDTRLEFLAIDESHRRIITRTVEYYLKKK
ncbi:MAG: PilZ domain-containing protein [Candidatus Omnitrophota bacterium]